MSKIGILTFFKAENYGGTLQAYALQKKLNLMGYDAELINQLRPVNKEFKATQNFTSIITLKDKISSRGKINTQIVKVISAIAAVLFRKRDSSRKSRFQSFEDNHIRTTKKLYYNFDELYNTPPKYDTYIVGSDQVWNYSLSFSPEPYFLTFANQGKKISYAASIGQEYIPDEIKDMYKQWFESFDFISTREEQAEELVKKISSKDAVTVLDPTFLFTKEEWLKNLSIKEVEQSEPYLLIYTLSESPYIYELARHVASIKKLKIKRVVPRSWVLKKEQDIENIYDAGPLEFVDLIANAAFMLTNSFHGTAFSINFNVPFFSIPKSTLQNKSRFVSILNIVNLEDRLLYDGSEYPKNELLEVDFKESNKVLEVERKKSLDFLISAIGK